jgi:hypothetical protein
MNSDGGKMNETDVDLSRRITELEKRLGYANNRFILILLLVLLSIGMNVWWMIRPVRQIRVTDGLSTARLTPTELTIATSLGTGRFNTVMMELEEPSGKPLAGLSVGPRREGNLLLLDAGGDETLTREELSKLRRSLPNAEMSNPK